MTQRNNKNQNIKKNKLSAVAALLTLSALSNTVLAEAPVALIGGSVENQILIRGMIVNAGAAIGGMEGGNADLEVSVGTVHGNSEINGDVNNNISILGALGSIAIVNTGISWQGKLCAKTSVGSIGASTCTYDGE
jgi:hypothetical protein